MAVAATKLVPWYDIVKEITDVVRQNHPHCVIEPPDASYGGNGVRRTNWHTDMADEAKHADDAEWHQHQRAAALDWFARCLQPTRVRMERFYEPFTFVYQASQQYYLEVEFEGRFLNVPAEYE
jgi:hypothetical protein